MAKTVTARMKAARKQFHSAFRPALTSLQRALLKRDVGTHVRVDGKVAHRPGRSRLGPTGRANICPGRCGAPVARDMERCLKHKKETRP